jgi:hypothetical protein
MAGEAPIDHLGAKEVSTGYRVMLGVRDSMQWANDWLKGLVSVAKGASRFHAGRHLTATIIIVAWFFLLYASAGHARTEPTIEELKARVSSANVSDKAKICVEIAEKQLNNADKLYTADDVEKARLSLTDVVSYSELARDYSIQSRKHQKQTEIAIRTMTRKLNDLMHALGREEQDPIKDAISHLERARDDLLAAMFPKGAK